jgi:diaminopimelate epimerase
MIEFRKYHGTGNDFILIDNRLDVFTGDRKKFAKTWCHRQFGIGSDGIIFLQDSDHHDFEMDFYNPDGSQSFCGNGSRCVVQFAKDLGLIENEASFTAIDGEHLAKFTAKGVSVKMKDTGRVSEINGDFFIHTGSPHYISYETGRELRDIFQFGQKIRYSENYRAEGTNVNLVEKIDERTIRIRTYERGVENETGRCRHTLQLRRRVPATESPGRCGGEI